MKLPIPFALSILAIGCLAPRIAAAPAAGAKLWEFPVGASIQSSPAVGQDGTIYFGVDNGAVYALTPEGRKKWEFRTSGTVASSPAIAADGTIYITCTDRILYALNPDGSEKWRLMPGSGLVSSPAIGPDGTIYFGSVFGTLFAIEPMGFKKWTFPAEGNILSSPAISASGVIYFGSYDTNFYAVGLDGARKWRLPVGDRIGSSPAIGPDGSIYFGCNDTYLHVVSPHGERLWEYRTGGPVRSSPVIGKDGTVYIGSDDKKLHAISPEGRTKWEFATEGWIRSTPVLGADGTIHIASYDGKLYALNTNGVKKWEFATGGAIGSSPIIGPNGAIYFGSWDKNFYAVQGEASLAASPWPAFRRNLRRTGSLAAEGVPIAVAPGDLKPPTPPEPEPPPIIFPPVKEPTFTNRVTLPPVRFTDITATPHDLIQSNETIFLKPPPKPPRPPIERIRNDKVKPKLTLVSPEPKARFTHPLLVATGTAKDNEGLERVEYRFNGGDILAADGVAEWTVRLHMHPGRNTLEVRAVDLAGNTSDWLTLSCDYLITSPLLIQITGEGDITPNLARDLLEIGRTYTITAEPARGWVFARWTGGVNSEKPRLDFVMRTNLVLIANFVPKTTAPKAPDVEKEPPAGRPGFTLALEILGQGTVKPAPGRKPIPAGQTVSLAARPEKGHVFAGWKGDLSSADPEITFVMRSNLSLQAEFVPGPFAAGHGVYQALLWDTNGVSHERSGLLTLNVGTDGGYKGKLSFGGAAQTIEGQFDAQGTARKLIVRDQERSLTIELAVAIGPTNSSVTGLVRDQEGAIHFCAEPNLVRNIPGGGAARCTLVLLGVARTPGPPGDGFAALTVAPDGTLRLTGELSDGTRLEWTGALVRGGKCPLYVPLYGGRGSLSGWLNFGGDSALAITGQLAWFKPESPKDKLYPAGFSRLLTVAGNHYQPPASGQGMMPWVRGVVALSEGGLPEPLGNLVELDARHRVRVTFASDDKFQLNLSPATGLFEGVFVHPVTQKATPFHGALLQQTGWGSGHFVGPGGSGLVFLGPNKRQAPPASNGK